MKTPVAVTLIIMGGLIVMTPVISDYFYQQNLVAVLNHGATSVNLDGKMDDLYRIGCWLTGSVMIAFATFCSIFAGKATEPENLAAQKA
jgi:uncharacterized membrane protein YjgN (DUF898 family)